jgi:hypothetical protein
MVVYFNGEMMITYDNHSIIGAADFQTNLYSLHKTYIQYIPNAQLFPMRPQNYRIQYGPTVLSRLEACSSRGNAPSTAVIWI